MKKLKKIIFPLYNPERHKFLVEKWWFRILIVLYVIAFVIAPFVIWIWYLEQETGWCYNSLYLYYDDQNLFNTELANCTKIAQEAWKTGIPIAIFGWLVVHYLIQIIFFKIIINYIVLGGNK